VYNDVIKYSSSLYREKNAVSFVVCRRDWATRGRTALSLAACGSCDSVVRC